MTDNAQRLISFFMELNKRSANPGDPRPLGVNDRLDHDLRRPGFNHLVVAQINGDVPDQPVARVAVEDQVSALALGIRYFLQTGIGPQIPRFPLVTRLGMANGRGRQGIDAARVQGLHDQTAAICPVSRRRGRADDVRLAHVLVGGLDHRFDVLCPGAVRVGQ